MVERKKFRNVSKKNLNLYFMYVFIMSGSHIIILKYSYSYIFEFKQKLKKYIATNITQKLRFHTLSQQLFEIKGVSLVMIYFHKLPIIVLIGQSTSLVGQVAAYKYCSV